MTFLYVNIYIICDFHKCLDFLIMLSTLKFSFHCFFNIKNNLTLFSISKVLIFKKFLFVFINIFFIVFFFKLSLHFVFKKPLIFLINIIVIMFFFLYLLMLLSFSF